MSKFKSPLNKLIPRLSDAKGHGDFGMPRGSRKHKGWDIVGEKGENVYAPFSGKITKYGTMYAHATQFKYIQIENETYRIRLGYAKLFIDAKVGDIVTACDIVGHLQDIGEFWSDENGTMKNHLHIQLYKNGLLTDPEPLFI